MRRGLSIPIGILVCMVFVAPAALAANRPSATSVSGVARGYAYAGYSSVTAGSSLGSDKSVLGPLAEADVNCSLSSSTSTQNTVNASQGKFVSAGSAQDVVTTTYSASSISSRASLTIHDMNMLSGLISASLITVVANSMGRVSSATSSNGTSFIDLKVAGKSQSDTPAPNTTIPLPGIGHVVLNEQDGPSNSFSSTHIRVYAIDVYVTVSSLFGLEAGSRIIVGAASSNFQRTARPSLVNASSYGAYSRGAANLLHFSTGTLAPASIDCLGGSNSQKLSAFSAPAFGNIGVINDSASGQITASATRASAQSTISELNLLRGLIQGDNIAVQANADWNGRGSALATTTLINLRIDGTRISQSPAPNTTYSLAGLGTVTLNVQYIHITSTSVWSEVVGILIKVTQKNLLGLSIGSEIMIGHAAVSVSV